MSRIANTLAAIAEVAQAPKRRPQTLAEHVAAVNAERGIVESAPKRRARLAHPPATSAPTQLAKKRGRPAKPRAEVVEQSPDAEQPRAGYHGPMVVLREALPRYMKAENGQMCCGDTLAQVLGKHPRDVVIPALVEALDLEVNPYLHLNAGQQSMNLRNRVRAVLKSGKLKLGVVRALVKVHAGERV
jgi:hypothetical protein